MCLSVRSGWGGPIAIRAALPLALVLSQLTSSIARGEDSSAGNAERGAPRLSDYCSRAREASKSTASLLLGPRVVLQGIKYPQGGDLQLGLYSALPQTQARAFVEYSLTRAYQGLISLQLGDADCHRQQFAQPLEEAVHVATDQGKRAALAVEIAFLDDTEPTIERLESEAEARQRAGVSTLVELADVHALASALRALRNDAREELTRLDAMAVPEPTGPLAHLTDDYRRATMDLEQLGSRIRQVAPWGVSVAGGVAATTQKNVDWFGTVEVSYNLGGLVQASAEREFLSARARELESATYELSHQARALDAALAKSTDVLKKQIAVVEASARALRGEAAALEPLSAPNQMHLSSVIKLRLLAADAQLVYLHGLEEQRKPWEDSDGRR